MILRFFGMAILLISPGLLIAQTNERREPAGSPLTIQQLVSPSFKVSPLVIQVESRRGRTVPVEYVMESSGRPTRVQIAIVSLRQEESGVIMPDEAAVEPGVVRIDGPLEFVLNPDEPRVVSGEIRVPVTDSSFLSYGLLVRDLGVEQENAPSSANGEARVRLKFVTQYLCRADITVQGGRGADVSGLQLEQGGIVEVDGMPKACVYVSNPTESPVEFETRCRLVGRGKTARRKSLPMVMPARASAEPDLRYVGRILPGSRVRLEAMLPDAVFAGDYDLHTELLSRGRPVGQRTDVVVVEENAFPAMAIAAVMATSGVYASPAQMEVSLQRGGDRVRTVTLTNENDSSVIVRLRSVDSQGRSAEWVTIRPAEIKLAPGASRKVSVSPAASAELSENRYGFLAMEVQHDGQDVVAGDGKVAFAVVSRESPSPELKITDMKFDSEARYPSFVVTLSNPGSVHAPVDGRITLMSESGQLMDIRAGFGKWLMPGDSTDLAFPVRNPPENGSYQLQTEIYCGDASPILTRADRVELKFTRTAAAGGPSTR